MPSKTATRSLTDLPAFAAASDLQRGRSSASPSSPDDRPDVSAAASTGSEAVVSATGDLGGPSRGFKSLSPRRSGEASGGSSGAFPFPPHAGLSSSGGDGVRDIRCVELPRPLLYVIAKKQASVSP